MALQLSGLRWNLDEDKDALLARAAKKLRLPPDALRDGRLLRSSTDARKKEDIHFLCTVGFSLGDAQADTRLLGKKIPGLSAMANKSIPLSPGAERLGHRPVVVGSGPAGLFAAYLLAREGYQPILLERGSAVEKRSQDVARLWEKGELDEESNVQFGEGGAGTFSDGKLTTRSKDPRAAMVLDVFRQMGAPEDIVWKAKAHIGTDCLVDVVKNMRQYILARGGEAYFDSKLTGLRSANGALQALTLAGSKAGELPAEVCVLAIGHSARDSYQMLHDTQLAMEAKPFAVGLRMEHPQELIDKAQYGKMAGHPRLGAADYQLTAKGRDGRGVYSFCMCPGGEVVCAASEEGRLTVNGMSRRARDGANANAAIVVQVNPEDCGHGVLAGMAFQREMERHAYQAGGGHYVAPAQRQADFLQQRRGTGLGALASSYRRGLQAANLWELLPGFCAQGIADALPQFARKIQGFDLPDALLIGVETRTSAPLRILRDENGEAANLKGLYPAGEGAGYAGGIVSAAIDGLKAAERIIERYAPLVEKMERDEAKR